MNIIAMIINRFNESPQKFSGVVKTIDSSKNVLFKWAVPLNTVNVIKTSLKVVRTGGTEGDPSSYIIADILTCAKNIGGKIDMRNMGNTYWMSQMNSYSLRNNGDGPEDYDGNKIIFSINGANNQQYTWTYECEIIDSLKVNV